MKVGCKGVYITRTCYHDKYCMSCLANCMSKSVRVRISIHSHLYVLSIILYEISVTVLLNNGHSK